jgi:hypothetical protein
MRAGFSKLKIGLSYITSFQIKVENYTNQDLFIKELNSLYRSELLSNSTQIDQIAFTLKLVFLTSITQVNY